MVHKYPHEVTIYEGGPMTNLALAISLDPQFAALAQELVFMGGSLNPQTSDPEFANNPRHEFNFWFDPEAAYIVLRAPWKKITCTPADISIKTRLSPQMVKRIDASGTALAHYIARFYKQGDGNDYMWDELAAAAWLDPAVDHQTGNPLLERGHRPRRRIRQHAVMGRTRQAQRPWGSPSRSKWI